MDRRRAVVRGAVVLGAAALLIGGGPVPAVAASPRSVRVFAAASLAGALDEATALWRSRRAALGVSVGVSLSYAASSTLARQIELGAPADLFVSANTTWMDHLGTRDAVAPETRRDLLSNRLVLVAAAGQATGLDERREIDGEIDLLAALGADGRLATGRVKTVPLGIYAKAALEALGLWDSVATRLAQAESARVAYAYVARGETPLGVLYASDLAGESERAAPNAPRRIGLFPQRSHPRILYPAALTPAGAKAPMARDLLDFLASEHAAAVFQRHGFEQPAP